MGWTRERLKRVLYIGGVYGGPEVSGSGIDVVIGRIATLIGEGRVEDSGSLDIVFHVAGSLVAPDYVGVRTGRLSKRERLLQVQISVPAEVSARGRADVESFVLEALHEAIRIAGPRFAKAKIPYRQSEYERLLERIEKAYSPN